MCSQCLYVSENSNKDWNLTKTHSTSVSAGYVDPMVGGLQYDNSFLWADTACHQGKACKVRCSPHASCHPGYVAQRKP